MFFKKNSPQTQSWISRFTEQKKRLLTQAMFLKILSIKHES